MASIEHYIHTNLYAAWICITLSFVVLFKCADLFVDCSVEVARRFRIPRLIIGIVLVSLATTLPELAVSVIAAFKILNSKIDFGPWMNPILNYAKGCNRYLLVIHNRHLLRLSTRILIVFKVIGSISIWM